MTIAAQAPARTWHPVCVLRQLVPGRGAAVLLRGRQIALYRLASGAVYAVGNYDPYGGAHVMSRGLTGSRGGAPTVASPLHKQVFDLRTGECLDDPAGPGLGSWPVRVAAGIVEVGLA